MQDILTCAMGLDVHRDVIVACLARGELGTEPEIEIIIPLFGEDCKDAFVRGIRRIVRKRR